jgi:transcriptional regulator of arginine metabolism
MTKTQRQHRIAQLLTSTWVPSQAHLVGLLRDEGIEATQATVSRDLVELGAVKVRGADGRRSLTLPAASVPALAAPDHLRRVLSEWVVDVSSSGSIVVVKTPPGCAHVVASALDRGVLAATLGTVAGDDTIFVVVDERVGGAAVAAEVRAIAGLPSPSPRPSNGHRPRRAAASPTKRGR